jgi:hypothetical protein
VANWASTVNPQDLERDRISLATYSGERPDPIFDVTWNPRIQAKSSKHEWGEKYLRSDTTTLNANVDNAVTTITVPTGYGAKLDTFNQYTVPQGTVNCVLVIDQEEMLITAGAGTDSLTVTRGAFGTTAAAHTAGATIKIIPAHLEGEDYGLDSFQGAVTNYNLTQIFRKDLLLSGSMQAFDGLAGDNTIARQLTEKDIQIMKQLANAIYLGNRYGSTNEANRRMGGIRYYAKKDNTGYTLAKTFIENNVIIPLLEGGADPNNLVLAVPNSLYGKITALKTNLVQNGGMRQDEKVIIADVDYYEFGNSRLQTIRSTCVPNGNVVAFDKSRIDVIADPGRLDVEEKLAKSGDSDRVMKLSEVTTVCRNFDTTAIWYTGIS